MCLPSPNPTTVDHLFRYTSNQAEGKKRMKAIGKVDVPQEAFMAVLKLEKEVL